MTNRCLTRLVSILKEQETRRPRHRHVSAWDARTTATAGLSLALARSLPGKNYESCCRNHAANVDLEIDRPSGPWLRRCPKDLVRSEWASV